MNVHGQNLALYAALALLEKTLELCDCQLPQKKRCRLLFEHDLEHKPHMREEPLEFMHSTTARFPLQNLADRRPEPLSTSIVHRSFETRLSDSVPISRVQS